jgi:hypothetical protein
MESELGFNTLLENISDRKQGFTNISMNCGETFETETMVDNYSRPTPNARHRFTVAVQRFTGARLEGNRNVHSRLACRVRNHSARTSV